ncbi:MAG: hypothetical protein ABL883_06215 [Terricaulis sp.]
MGAASTPPELHAEFEHVADMRQNDRRGKQRRQAPLKLDLLFAATLMSQIETAPIKNNAAYSAPYRRYGKYVNLRT